MQRACSPNGAAKAGTAPVAHMNGAAIPSTETRPIEALRPNPLNPRGELHSAGLEELPDSIRAQGVLQPLLVTPAGVVVAGHRRLAAARLTRTQRGAGRGPRSRRCPAARDNAGREPPAPGSLRGRGSACLRVYFGENERPFRLKPNTHFGRCRTPISMSNRGSEPAAPLEAISSCRLA
jgi:hypothetical protein